MSAGRSMRPYRTMRPDAAPPARARAATRAGRWLAAGALMSIWIVLPLLPAFGVLLTWWLGIF